jgi:hypothetical protein
MKIKIEAFVYAPGIMHWYGGKNPSIFSGIFEREISAEEKLNLGRGSKIQQSGIELTVRKITGSKYFTCVGQLPSVSISFFQKLKQAGWKVDLEAATKYGLPNDSMEVNLQAEIAKYRLEIEANIALIQTH